MKQQTQLIIHYKDLQDFDYVIKMQTLEKTLKQSFIDYSSEEDCLISCN